MNVCVRKRQMWAGRDL